MFWVKFGWNWPSESGEEDENVKKIYDNDNKDDGQISLEISAQVS